MNPSQNYSLTSSTTFSHLVGSLPSPLAAVPSLVALYLSSDPDVSPSASVSSSVAASAALCSCSHSRRCLTRIREGPHDRCPRSLLNSHSASSSVGTESSIGEGSTDMGIVSPGGGTARYSSSRSAVIRLSVTQAGVGA